MCALRSLCSYVAIALIAAPAFAQSPPPTSSDGVMVAAAAVRATASRTERRLRDRAVFDGRVGPRPAGSQGDRAAVAWALAQMQDAGLANVHAESVTVPHWERGTADVRLLEPYPQKLTAVALGGSIGTDEGGLEAPVLEVADLDELAKLPDRVVRGTIVYFSARMERTRDGAGYVKAVRARSDGPSAVSRRGAVGMLMRSAGTSSSRVAHTGMTHYDPDVTPVPALALAHADADLLEEELAAGTPVVARRLQLTARSLAPVRSANVVGEIPGRGDGIVLLGAHLDSWDLGTGAIDDGAGVGIVLATAHLLKQRHEQLAHAIRIVLFANEEFGLSGANAYAADHADEVSRHVLGLEADFGSAPVWRLDSRVAETALPVVTSIYDAIATLGVERGGNEAHGGADLGPIRDLGVPVLDLLQDGTHYFDVHHTADDTLDKINAAELDRAVAAFATATYIAAAVETDFGRLPPPETPPHP
jgi:hypothetical protein